MSESAEHVSKSDERPDYLALWQHIEANGDADKGKMITVVSWLLGFATAILGVIAAQCFFFDLPSAPLVCVHKPSQALTYSALGLLICLYSMYLVVQFEYSARQNWAQADKLRSQIPLLNTLLQNLKAEGWPLRDYTAQVGKMMPFFKSFLSIVVFVAALYLLIACVALFGCRC